MPETHGEILRHHKEDWLVNRRTGNGEGMAAADMPHLPVLQEKRKEAITHSLHTLFYNQNGVAVKKPSRSFVNKILNKNEQ
jgi:hypothetical protein